MAAERQKLIERLSAYKKQKAHDITVVFDGWKGGENTETHSTEAGVKIIYSRLGETADAVIKRIIAEQRHYIVVSSDRDIQTHAWSHDSVPVDSEEFFEILEGKVSDLKTYGSHEKHRGNPKPLSKKAKAVRKALSKL